MSSRDVKRFLNSRGQVERWPSKYSDKVLVIAHLAAKFDPSKSYSEQEVNELLKQWHTFDDWSLLRRELFEYGYLDRERDGSNYWLTDKLKKESS